MIEKLLARCHFPAHGSPIDCAVSGGADSTALLILAVEAGCEATAFHVDHGLRPGSAAEADHVAALAGRFGARFESRRVTVSAGPNLEERCRTARYEVLPADVATGHTADDQAETIVLAMMRGAALHGLGAMEPGPRRPLLALRRDETEAVCAHFGVDVVHDPTNDDGVHRRNRVRHELLPLLCDVAERDVVPVLNRQAELMRQTAAFVVASAEVLDPTDVAQLRAADVVVAREAVRRWIRTAMAAAHPPDLATVDRVLAVARLEARATDIGKGWRVHRSAGRLRIVAPG